MKMKFAIQSVLLLQLHRVKAPLPPCDLTVDSAICIGEMQTILMPDARPYGCVLNISFDSEYPVDKSGNKNHGSGKFFPSAGVNGQGTSAMFRQNYIEVKDSASLNFLDFSYSFFLNLLQDENSIQMAEKRQQFCPIIHKGNMGQNISEAAPAILVDPKEGRLKIVVGTTASKDSAGEEFVSNFRLLSGLWYHITVIRHLKKIKLFVDGILDSVLVTEGLTHPNNSPLFIGAAPYSIKTCDVPLLIDNLRVYNVPLGIHFVQAEASCVAAVEPANMHIGCSKCTKHEAQSACSSEYHLCSSLELYDGVYRALKKFGLPQSNVVNEASLDSDSGIGICCRDL